MWMSVYSLSVYYNLIQCTRREPGCIFNDGKKVFPGHAAFHQCSLIHVTLSFR